MRYPGLAISGQRRTFIHFWADAIFVRSLDLPPKTIVNCIYSLLFRTRRWVAARPAATVPLLGDGPAGWPGRGAQRRSGAVRGGSAVAPSRSAVMPSSGAQPASSRAAHALRRTGTPAAAARAHPRTGGALRERTAAGVRVRLARVLPATQAGRPARRSIAGTPQVSPPHAAAATRSVQALVSPRCHRGGMQVHASHRRARTAAGGATSSASSAACWTHTHYHTLATERYSTRSGRRQQQQQQQQQQQR